ncbi:MAG: hypothetical protein AAF721_35075 [Myxococcota bacterium]
MGRPSCSRIATLLACTCAFVVACDSGEATKATPVAKTEPKSDPKTDPKQDPKQDPAPAAKLAITIASVQMIEDCPAPKAEATPEPPVPPAAAAPEPPTKPTAAAKPPPPPAEPISESAVRRGAPGRGGFAPIEQPCTQSTMQLSARNPGDAPATIVIADIRLLDAKTKKDLAAISSREAMAWKPGGTYEPWDQRVPAGETIKASYKLGVPSWSAVDEAIGGGSMGHGFVLQITMTIDGTEQTVTSPEFAREPPHVIVT